MIGPLVLRSCARRVLPGFGHILAFALAPSCAALGDDLKPRGPNFHQRHCDSPTCAMSLLSWLAAFFMNSGIGKQNKKKKTSSEFPKFAKLEHHESYSDLWGSSIQTRVIQRNPSWSVDKFTEFPNASANLVFWVIECFWYVGCLLDIWNLKRFNEWHSSDRLRLNIKTSRTAFRVLDAKGLCKLLLEHQNCTAKGWPMSKELKGKGRRDPLGSAIFALQTKATQNVHYCHILNYLNRHEKLASARNGLGVS